MRLPLNYSLSSSMIPVYLFCRWRENGFCIDVSQIVFSSHEQVRYMEAHCPCTFRKSVTSAWHHNDYPAEGWQNKKFFSNWTSITCYGVKITALSNGRSWRLACSSLLNNTRYLLFSKTIFWNAYQQDSVNQTWHIYHFRCVYSKVHITAFARSFEVKWNQSNALTGKSLLLSNWQTGSYNDDTWIKDVLWTGMDCMQY